MTSSSTLRDTLSPIIPLETKDRLERAERTLACLARVFGHDLPNLLLVIQGLSQLLEMEEGHRLSVEGRDYLRRILNASQKTQEMSRLLREISRLSALANQAHEQVALAALVEEVVAETKLLFPTAVVECDLGQVPPVVRVNRRALNMALTEVVNFLIRGSTCPKVQVLLQARTSAEEVVLASETTLGVPSSIPSGQPLGLERTALENRLELVLVRELAAIWGGKMHTVAEAGRCCRITLSMPLTSHLDK